ncbi:MAG: hypothetical protein WCF57_09215 [Pyrinomonadaceae bacterium]
MRYVLTLLGGLVIGGALVFFLFVGAPRAKPLPGSPVKPPEQGGDPPGTALVTLDEKFFDALLATIFRDLGAPSFPLQFTSLNGERRGDAGAGVFQLAVLQQDGCANSVVIAPEDSNVKTGVRLTEGKIMAPLAFSGSYNAFGSCMNFKGWAQANIELRFDQAQQTVYGQITVEGVNLEGTSPIVGGLVTPLVQRAINDRVNPLEIMRSSQLTLAIPVKASNGTLKAQVKDVRSEVKDNTLRLHITYDFSAVKGE